VIRATTLVLLLGLSATACGGRVDPGAAPEPGPDEPVGTTVPSPNPNASPRPTEVTPEPGLLDARPQPWDGREVIDEDTVRLSFYGGTPDCYGLAAVDVRYHKDEIVITLSEGRRPGAEVCIDIALLKSVTVSLDEPIDGRAIVDGALRSAA